MARRAKSGDAATMTAGQETAAESGGESTSLQGYFRRFYDANPHLLKIRANDEAFRQWLADHPAETEVPQRVKNAVSNVKNLMRGQKKKKKKDKSADADNGAAKTAPKTPAKVLVTLEEQIDSCLSMAKNLAPTGLEDVIQSLRRARNEVIVRQGGV